MDANMWNTYHLMSNRARAVCYAARNTQFRALTELTVNKLMRSSHSQIEALTSLKVHLYIYINFYNDLYINLFLIEILLIAKSRSFGGTNDGGSVIVISGKQGAFGTATVFKRRPDDSL